MIRFSIALVASIGLLAGGAVAQPAPANDVVTDPAAPGVVYKKRTEYDFEDDVIEGSFVRPEGDYIDARRAAKHNSLIRIRENFLPEMLKSAEDI